MSPLVVTAAVIVLVLVLMIRLNRHPDIIVWGGVTLLVVIPVGTGSNAGHGVLSPAAALSGLSNEGVVAIAALFIVAAGMRETGALQLLTARLLGAPGAEHVVRHRLLWPTAMLSGFFNNTPLIALLLPAVDDWCKRARLPVGRLLMPLSFASILGGACTLVGTSTNLIISGWLVEHGDHPGLGMFEMTPMMLPIAVVGLLFVVYLAPWLLPERKPVFEELGDAREYVVEMQVEGDSELVGHSIDDAGLRGLPGLFLIEIERGGEALPAVSANVVLQAGDHLIFAGIVDSVVDLQRFSGLRPATDQVYKLDQRSGNRHLIEAVVSDSCPLVGRTIRAGRFRTVYNAAVIAVARNGERVKGKIGDIELSAGDVLLLEARASFVDQQRNRRDFYLVSEIDARQDLDTGRAQLSLAILAAFVVAVASGALGVVAAALLAAMAMMGSGCARPSVARRAIDWEVLLVIAGALALGDAMQESGLAGALGDVVVALAGAEPRVLLGAIFLLSAVLAGVISAKAGALLMLPICVAVAEQLGISYLPLVFAVMLGSSMAVATPIAYPTNLMVYGPGGYHFSDYLRVGVPLTLLIGVLGLLLIPWLWPFAA